MNKSQNFTEGKIFAPLVNFALPVLLALFLQTMYGAVDLLIVGQFATAADVSGVSTGSQLMNTVTVVITGLAMGLTVLVGRKIGEGNGREAGKIIGSGICLFAAVAAILSVAVIVAAPSLASILHAPAEAFDKTVSYIRICSAGTVFIVAYNLVGSIFRGIGDSKVPLMTVAIACVLNILGDLLLVAVFDMGASGAAVATVFAQAFSVLLSLLIIRRSQLPFSFSPKDIRPDMQLIKKILFLGTPIALQDLLVSISFLVLLAIINKLGLIASAGVGVAQKLCSFIMLVPSSYMQSMSAFVAQNMGAGKPERARKALLCGIASSFVVGVIMCYCACFHGDVLSGIFAKDTEVIMASFDYLKSYGIDCLFVAFLFCFIGYFNGCGYTMFVMLQGIVGAFAVRIPVSWIISKQAGATLFHIGLATPASTVIQIILCGVYFIIIKKKQDKAYLIK
ncbi:MAG: MATE family efflux transporter [Firmicutes bacterium]|nr:MATE family efflux transporter [Bacillota bacterium]